MAQTQKLVAPKQLLGDGGAPTVGFGQATVGSRGAPALGLCLRPRWKCWGPRAREAAVWCAVVAAGWVLLGVPARAAVESTPEGVRFSLTSATATAVYVTGEFNGWSGTANPMQQSGEVFATVVRLGPGEHPYKFVIDGNWTADPDNPVTVGEYGNSVIRVGATGLLLAMEATSNTPLSPKIMLHGRYIGLFVGREDEGNQDRFSLRRPDFNIDFDFGIRASEVLNARVLTKLRNEAEGTPLWETSLRFDRGYLDLHRQRFAVRVFDNDAIGTWDDPLHLVGDIGRYSHEFGFEQQGVRGEAEHRGFVATAFYADNFEVGDPTVPPLDTLGLGQTAVRYDFNLQDTNKNVFALRLRRTLRPELHAALALRNDRGFNPGSLSRVQTAGANQRRELFVGTNEQWLGGGGDLHWGSDESRAQAFAELLYGEAWVSPGEGTVQEFGTTSSGDTLLAQRTQSGERLTLDRSNRWKLGGRVRALADVGIEASLERERHGLHEAATDSTEFFRNRMLVYRAALKWDAGPRLDLPVQLGLGFESFDFFYAARTPWATQLWFADRNFWMEHNEHRLPVSRYVQLGGQDATTWTPWLTVQLPRGVALQYEGAFRGQELDQEIELWESYFKLSVPVMAGLELYSQTRWAKYDEPVLALHSGYVATFAELEYTFSPAITVALSYGVDPFILDVVTNEYDDIGINEFLIQAGASPNLARDAYAALGTRLRAAESQLEDERRVQVEAIVKF